jgi:DNA-binding protein YbaB
MSIPDPAQRMADLDAMISDYPRRVADLTRQVADAAGRTVSGQDTGGLVTVTCTGQGQVRSVQVSVRARRDLDNRQLAARVTEAANAALARAEDMLTSATGGQPDDGDTDRHLAAFENRMDDMLYELGRMGRMLDRLGE